MNTIPKPSTDGLGGADRRYLPNIHCVDDEERCCLDARIGFIAPPVDTRLK